MPLPWETPKPVPVNVTAVPDAPEAGLMLVRLNVSMVNGNALLQTLFCSIWTLPEELSSSDC
jgi:hypothetical protein